MTVLFLYTELADYFLKCCDELSKTHSVHIIRWPVNKEAPFNFGYREKIKIYEKDNYSYSQLSNLVQQINPDIIVCSGWVDKHYLKLTRPYFKKIPTVITCDTHWTGSLKQYVATILSRFFLLNTFSHAWVPGSVQEKYVKKLGFALCNIVKGFYCCDLQKFNEVYKNNNLQKQNNFPKRFLYVGRYYDFKGIVDLWTAFIGMQQDGENDWELWCLGTGSISPIEHPKIRHFGFVQPKDLDSILEKTGVFILPSRFEPWGVVVQEYAAAGFPLLVSDAVGAKELFLDDGGNGYSFKSQDVQDLKNHLIKITQLTSKDLNLLSERSHELAQKITPLTWANSLTKIYTDFHKKKPSPVPFKINNI
jgi:glycosyltransferase involved in cell wall biosynthesis